MVCHTSKNSKRRRLTSANTTTLVPVSYVCITEPGKRLLTPGATLSEILVLIGRDSRGAERFEEALCKHNF